MHYLKRFAPCGKRRVRRIEFASRDRRTLVGFSAFGARRWGAGFRLDFAGSRKDLAGFCQENRLKSSQNRPKSLFGASLDEFSDAEAKKSEPRAPQERPKRARERPKSAQEGPKSAPRASRRVPRRLSRRSGEPSGTILTLTSSKKERSASDLLRNSLEKTVRRDFLLFFEACAQGRTCEKPVKTYGFCRFFVCRRFFERTGQQERKTFEKSPKSSLRGVQNRPKSDQNRSGKRSFWSFGQRKRARAVQERPRVAQEALKSAQERAKRAT